MQRRISVTSIKLVFIFVVLSSVAPEIYPEAFGNNSITVPKFGMSFFDTPLVFHRKPWGLNHQWTFGTAFTQAINYRFWWIVETSMGFGRLTTNNRPYIGAFSGGAGLRFNIFQGDFRPHVGTMIHYLHFLGEGVKHMPLNLGWPIFVGLKPYFGMEWLFYSEMALVLEGGYAFYLNINEPFRQVLHTSLSFAFYF